MSAVIGSLRADLSMRSVAFNKGVDEATRKLSKLRYKFRRVGSQVKEIGKGLSVSMTGAVAALGGLSVAASRALGEVGNLSRLAGMQADAFKVVAIASAEFGIGQEKLADVLKDVNDKFGDYFQTGAGPLADFFDNIAPNVGLTAEAFRGLSSADALGLFVKSLEDANVSQQEMTFYMEALASDATALLPVFAKNAEALDEVRQKANDLGFALSDETIASVQSARREFSIVSEVLKTQLQASLVDLLPVFSSLAQAMVPVMQSVVSAIAGLSEKLQSLSPKLKNLVGIGVIVAAALGPLLIVTGGLIASFSTIAPVVVSLTVPMAALASLAAGIVAAWKPLTKAVGFLRDNMILLSPVIGQMVVVLASRLVPALIGATAGFAGLAAAVGAKLVKALRVATAGFVTLRGAIMSTSIGLVVVGVAVAIQKFIELVNTTGGVGNAFRALKDIALEVWERIGLSVDRAGFTIAAMASNIKASILEAVGGVVTGLPKPLNKIIGGFVGAFKAMKAIWSQLPQVMANVVVSAANLVLSGIENMINFAREALWSFVSGAADLVSNIPGVKIDIEPLDEVKLRRVELQAESTSTTIKGAFDEAFNRDYTGEMGHGLENLAQSARGAAEGFETLAERSRIAAVKPLASIGALTKAQKAVTEETEDTGDAIADAETEAERLLAVMNKVSVAGGSMGDRIGSGAGRIGDALELATDQAQELRKELSGVFDGFLKALSSGGVQNAFSNLFASLKDKAATSFSSLISNAFNQGGGFGAVLSGLKQSWSGITSGFGSLFSGGGLSGLVGSALPVLGAVSTIVNLVKGFSSKKIIGGGFNLGINGGDITGGTFKRIKKSSFWGLFKKTYDQKSQFETENLKALQSQLSAVQGSVKSVFGSLGVTVSDGLLNSVNLAVKRINTKGLSDDEIQAKVQAVFTEYGDALSNAVGGIGLELSGNLAQVQSLLTPLGKAFDIFGNVGRFSKLFDIFGRRGKTFSKNMLKASANAAQALADMAGGMDALGKKTATFYDRFFTEQEKLANIQTQVDATFAKLGLSVPKTDEAFKQLVLSQDLMTEAGRRAYDALLSIAPQFDTLTDAAQEAQEAQLEAAQKTQQAQLEVARKQREELQHIKDERQNTIFDLLPEKSQFQILKKQVNDVFAGLGQSIPKTSAGLAKLLDGLNLNTDIGKSAYEAIKSVIPAFEKLQDVAKTQKEAAEAAADAFRDAVADMRGEYALDAGRYATEFEARLAHELGNQGHYQSDVINAQNAELRRQSALLDRVVSLLGKQNKLSNDKLLLDGLA